MVVIGVDPGGTTGVSVFLVPSEHDSPLLLESLQWGNPDTVPANLLALKSKYLEDHQIGKVPGASVVFVIEQFDKRPGVADPDFTPMFIIKDINRDMPNETIVWQTPSQAKNLVKPAHRGAPDGLKRFGWYKVGMGHANDASRHVIVFLVEKIKHMPTIHRGWPKRDN